MSSSIPEPTRNSSARAAATERTSRGPDGADRAAFIQARARSVPNVMPETQNRSHQDFWEQPYQADRRRRSDADAASIVDHRFSQPQAPRPQPPAARGRTHVTTRTPVSGATAQQQASSRTSYENDAPSLSTGLKRSKSASSFFGDKSLPRNERQKLWWRNALSLKMNGKELGLRLDQGNLDGLTSGQAHLLAVRLKETFDKAGKHNRKREMWQLCQFAKELERKHFGPQCENRNMDKKRERDTLQMLRYISFYGNMVVLAKQPQLRHLKSYQDSRPEHPLNPRRPYTTIQEFCNEYVNLSSTGKLFNNSAKTKVDFITWYKFSSKGTLYARTDPANRNAMALLDLIERSSGFPESGAVMKCITYYLTKSGELTDKDCGLIHHMLKNILLISNNQHRDRLFNEIIDSLYNRGHEHPQRKTLNEHLLDEENIARNQGRQLDPSMPKRANLSNIELDLTSGPDSDYYGYVPTRGRSDARGGLTHDQRRAMEERRTAVRSPNAQGRIRHLRDSPYEESDSEYEHQDQRQQRPIGTSRARPAAPRSLQGDSDGAHSDVNSQAASIGTQTRPQQTQTVDSTQPPQPLPAQPTPVTAPQALPDRAPTPQPTTPSWGHSLAGLQPDPASELARAQQTLRYLQGQLAQSQQLLAVERDVARQGYLQQQIMRIQSDINRVGAESAALQAQLTGVSGGTFVAPTQQQPQPQPQPQIPVYPYAQQIGASQLQPQPTAMPPRFPQQAGTAQLLGQQAGIPPLFPQQTGAPQQPSQPSQLAAIGPIIGDLMVPPNIQPNHCYQAIDGALRDLQQQQATASPMQLVRAVAQRYSNYLPTPPTMEQVIQKWKTGFALNDSNVNRFALGLMALQGQQPLTPADLTVLYFVGVRAASLGVLGNALFNELRSLARTARNNIAQKVQTNTQLYNQQQAAIDTSLGQFMVALGNAAEQRVATPLATQSLLGTLANLSTGKYIAHHDWDFLFFTWINSYANPALNQDVNIKHLSVMNALQIPQQDRAAFENGLTTLMWKNLGVWVWVTDIASGIAQPPAGHPQVSPAVRQALSSEISQLGALGTANAMCEAELVKLLHDNFLQQQSSASPQP
ncbi:MAG: hypothetical protein ACRCWB_03400 [Enterovibrio sp.]